MYRMILFGEFPEANDEHEARAILDRAREAGPLSDYGLVLTETPPADVCTCYDPHTHRGARYKCLDCGGTIY